MAHSGGTIWADTGSDRGNGGTTGPRRFGDGQYAEAQLRALPEVERECEAEMGSA